MARKLELSIEGDARDARRALEQTADGLEETGRQVGRLSDYFSKSAVQARLFAAEMSKVSRSVDEVGDQARQSARHVDELGDQLGQVGRKGFAAGLGSIAARLASFGSTAAKGFGNAFASGLSSLATSAPLIVAVATVGTVVATVLAGAISSALLLGVGGGALAVGIASALKDPRIDEALRGKKDTFQAGLGRKGEKQILGPAQEIRTTQGLLDKLKSLFASLGRPFVGPLVDSLDSMSKLLDRISPKIQTLVASATPLLAPLTATIGDLIEHALPGIQDAVRGAEPVFAMLAKHAAPLGDAISKFFSIIGESGPEAAVALGDLLSVIEAWLPMIAHVIGDLAHLWAAIHDGAVATKNFVVDAIAYLTARVLEYLGDIIHGAVEAFGWIPVLGPKLKQAADDFDSFAARVNIALAGIQSRDVAVRVHVSATDNNGHRVSIGEGMTIPRVGGFAEGGWVPGPPGAPRLAVVHGQEYVLSREMIRAANSRLGGTAAAGGSTSSAGGRTVTFAGHLDSAFATYLMKMIRTGQVVIT